jgi:hypothetical protein
MQRLIRVAAGVLLTLTLGSCAAGLKFTQLQPSIASQNPELGRIFFYRPSSFGAALRPDVLLNGEVVGEAISWGFFYVDRPPGEYQVVTSTEVTRKLSFILEKGQTRFVRFSTSFGFFVGHVYGELVDQETGLSEIQRCKYTGGGV